MFTHLDRSIFLTGVLSPPIIVNGGDPLKTLEYSVQMLQDIDINPMFLQGGPGKSFADFHGKRIGGNMTILPRISESNVLESSVIDLINSAQGYSSFISLSTLLLPYNIYITSRGPGFTSSTNAFIFDTCLIKSISINAKDDEEVKMNLEILGQNDSTSFSTPSLPNDTSNLYRRLTWYDCFFSRNGSQMENVKSFEIKIDKEIGQEFFIFPAGFSSSYDRPWSSGVKSVEVNFKFVEHITSLFDIFNFSFGGWSDAVHLAGNFGPISFDIPNVLYKVSSQNLPSGVIERTTEGFYRMNPLTPAANDFLLIIT